ncbi:MAG TPA: RagB/SusD family nutrient uptake outer membrane protein [Prolixibacteraceae bacterium]|nr:RagB/SusD family nutrient uptake outer membrane protein [Prolixibacteraceae bacterium]
MKKISKIIYTGLFTAIIAVSSLSCSDKFLKEDMVSSLTTSYFDTDAGLDALEVSLYQSLRFFFAEEHGYAMTNYGTDEFQVAGGTDYRFMNDYSATMSSVDPKPLFSGLSDWWDAIYGNINTANMLIQKAPEFMKEGEKQNTYTGEALFIRGFLYFRLVNQYGGVPLKLVPSEVIETEFTRATEKEVFAQIITDLTEAAKLLPATTNDGRISKATAWHFLAKVYLFRASEKHADITESTDLAKAIEYGLKVINKDEGTDRQLANDYYDFWNYLEEGPDGAAERNPEILLAAQFSNNSEKFDRLCNRTHLYFLPRYENNITGMTRVVQYGRPYQRLRPTDYTYDVFDRENDSRFWKTFRTLYISTKAANGMDINGSTMPYIVGETPCIKIIINDKNDTRYDSKYATCTYPNYWLRYYTNDNGDQTTSLATTQFAGLDKYLDPHRTGNQNDINGVRDGYLARIGETYLIVAEAYGRSNNYAKAVEYINTLRRRAGYSDGENRNPNANGSNPYFSGGTYYESTGIDEGTTTETKSKMEITEANFDAVSDAGIPYSVFGATSRADKFINFILNERTRELLGEFLRWEDLTRTKTLYKRSIPYNLDNAAPQLTADQATGKFMLRPVPQTFLDQVKTDGRLLTSDEKAVWQNPGW